MHIKFVRKSIGKKSYGQNLSHFCVNDHFNILLSLVCFVQDIVGVTAALIQRYFISQSSVHEF